MVLSYRFVTIVKNAKNKNKMQNSTQRPNNKVNISVLWLINIVENVLSIQNEMLSSIIKDKYLAICNKVKKVGEYYDKWNKSDTDRKALHDLSYM